MDKCKPLDHARVDPTVEDKSQYRISDGQWGGVYVIGDVTICDSDITLGKTLRYHIGGDIVMARDKGFAICDVIWAIGCVG